MTLKDEFKYYLENQGDLVEKYNGKTLVIKDKEVVGVFNDEAQAYIEASLKYEAGTFLIQRCSAGSEEYTQTFHSRVTFA